MNGGFVHDHIIIGALELRLRMLGAGTRRQAPVICNGKRGFIDLLATFPSHTLAIEVELSTARVFSDLCKAAAAGVHALWIVVPDRRSALAVRRGLGRLRVRAERDGVCVFTLGQALQRLANSFP